MHKIQKKLRIIILLLLPFYGLYLDGCSGFTTDWLGGSDANTAYSTVKEDDKGLYDDEFASAKNRRTFPLQTIANSDDNNTGMIVIDYGEEGLCLAKDGEFVWDDSCHSKGIDTLQYSFRGDTLLLTSISTNDSLVEGNQGAVEVSEIFVGGKYGRLTGVWKNTNDLFVNGELIHRSYDYFVYYKFEENFVTIACTEKVD